MFQFQLNATSENRKINTQQEKLLFYNCKNSFRKKKNKQTNKVSSIRKNKLRQKFSATRYQKLARN